MQLDDMLKKTIDCIRSAVESDEMIGKPIRGEDGSVILPISKLSYGFVVGGGEYGEIKDKADAYPYTGAAGGGVTITPIGFLVCGRDKRFVSVSKEEGGKLGELLRSAITSLKKDD